MSFQSYLENMRAKPEHIRKRYAFWSSFGLTAIIFVFWLSSFGSISAVSNETIAKAVDRAGTPAQSMIAGVGDFFFGITDLIFGPKKIEYKSVDVKPGNK